MKTKVLSALAILSIGLISIIGFGLRSMSIEDNYGDYEDFYYKSRSGDLIIQHKDSQIYKWGRVQKSLDRIYVKDSLGKFDLYHWARDNKEKEYFVTVISFDKDLGDQPEVQLLSLLDKSKSKCVILITDDLN